MRRRPAIASAVVVAGALFCAMGCSLLVDTSGLASGADDAATSNDANPMGDAAPAPGSDASGASDGASDGGSDAAPASTAALVKPLGTVSTLGAKTLSLITLGPVEVGNVVVVRAALDANTATAPSGFAVADGAGNSYVLHSARSNPAVAVVLFGSKVTKPIPAGSTITLTWQAEASGALAAEEFSGVDNAVDVQAATGGDDTSTGASTAATTTRPGCLLVAHLGLWGKTSTVALPDGWTPLERVEANAESTSNTMKSVAVYRVATEAGPQSLDIEFDGRSAWGTNLVALEPER